MAVRKNLYSSEGFTTAALTKKGLRRVLVECAVIGVKEVWLVSHAKSNLDSSVIEDVLGQQAIRALVSGKAVSVGDVSLRFYGERTLPSSANGAAVVACFPSEALLTKIDGVRDVRLLLVLPWMPGDVQKWVQAHAPEDITGAVQNSPLAVGDPVVVAALETIRVLINVKTGVSHPSDKATVIDAFKILRQGGIHYDPAAVRAWFVQNGMAPEKADDVAEIAANPARFRAPKGVGVLAPDILSKWRERAKQV